MVSVEPVIPNLFRDLNNKISIFDLKNQNETSEIPLWLAQRIVGLKNFFISNDGLRLALD